MEADALGRWLVVIGAAAAALYVVVGGLVTRVAGRWRDGDYEVTLVQLGPLLWGRARTQGGWQSYRGRARFGRVWLARADHGEAHLLALGFGADTWRQADGRVTGHLAFRLAGDRLVGTFTGRRFAVSDGKVSRVEAVAPVPRTWTSLAAAPGAAWPAP